MYPLRPGPLVDPGFLHSLVLGDTFSRFAISVSERSGIPKVNREELAQFQTCFPPLSEQRKIARILTTLDELIEKTEALIAKYQAIKQGMMHDLFTRGIDEHGHLRPLRSEAPNLYKSSELGCIPMEWVFAPLSDFAHGSPGSFVNGPFGSDLLTSELRVEGVPVIYVRDIKPGRYERVSTAHVSEVKANQLSVCNVLRGDVLIAKVGDPPCDCATYQLDTRAVVTQDVIRIRPGPAVDPSFLSNLMNSPVARDAMRRIIIQGTRARVSLTELKLVRLPKPSLPEQQEIARRLDTLAARITQEKLVVGKQRLTKTGLMEYLLTGKVRVKADTGKLPSSN
jgi:type I restriction enzyme S subunit